MGFLIRKSPEKMQGKSFEWTVKTGAVLSYSDEVWFAHPEAGHGIVVPDYSSLGFSTLHENDWVCFRGTFLGLDDDGNLLFKPKSLKNLGYSYDGAYE
jgi:hypothetical protein